MCVAADQGLSCLLERLQTALGEAPPGVPRPAVPSLTLPRASPASASNSVTTGSGGVAHLGGSAADVRRSKEGAMQRDVRSAGAAAGAWGLGGTAGRGSRTTKDQQLEASMAAKSAR